MLEETDPFALRYLSLRDAVSTRTDGRVHAHVPYMSPISKRSTLHRRSPAGSLEFGWSGHDRSGERSRDRSTGRSRERSRGLRAQPPVQHRPEAVSVDLPPVSQPPHVGDRGGGRSREEPASRALSIASLENESYHVRGEGSFPCRLHLPPPGGFFKAVVRVPLLGGAKGRNRGGAFRMLAWISRRPRPVSETRTCAGSSEATSLPVSRAPIGLAGPAASPRRRLRPSSGRPRRATSPHTANGEHPAGDPHQCRRARWRQR